MGRFYYQRITQVIKKPFFLFINLHFNNQHFCTLFDMTLLSICRRLCGISDHMYQMIPPPYEFLSFRWGVKFSTLNWAFGKELSIFVSVNAETSIYFSIRISWSANIWLRTLFILRCPKIRFLMLLNLIYAWIVVNPLDYLLLRCFAIFAVLCVKWPFRFMW